ncbi:MAG: NAD(P)H-hydrate dehydratase [Dehalococcoidia bacterium]
MKLVTAAEMQEAERGAGVPVSQLMENAGLAVARAAADLLGGATGRRILVLIGPGNNGGDGLVAARQLKEASAHVSVYLLTPRDETDATFAAVVQRDIPVIQAPEDAAAGYGQLQAALTRSELVIDALLGTGRARPIKGLLAEVLEQLRLIRSAKPAPRLLAVDLPTGLNSDSGVVDPRCVPADRTVTFGWSKPGLHTLPGSLYAGQVEVAEIGLPEVLEASIQTELMTESWARSALPERPPGAHKGTFGRALVVAGSPRYVGAAYLASMGSLRVGAGLVTLACARTIYPILAAKLTEATFEPLVDEDGFLTAEAAYSVRQAIGRGADALLVGPGLEQESYPLAFLRALLPLLSADELQALVIDADGLNNLASIDEWWKDLPLPTVVTPHPGEMSRLTGLTIDEIQLDRLAVARRCAGDWGVTVVLKGANTVVVAPDGRARLSPFVNPGLASGGTGDVLAGAIVGLLAQGLAPFQAASLAVYLHGLAGELVRRELGSTGMVAGDLLPALPRAMKGLRGE